MRSVPLWTVPFVIGLVVFGLAIPRLSTAQDCNRACDPSKRDTQGCCPAVPTPGPGTGPGQGPVTGRKCAVSAECPGTQVCIAYKCQRPPTTTPALPPPPPPPPLPGGHLLSIGVAWSNDGDWAVRTAPTMVDAQAQALQACKQFANGCYSSPSPVHPDRPMCIAIYRNGTALRSAQDANLQAAINRANQDCAAAGATGPGCFQEVAICNDRPFGGPSPWAHVGLAWNNKGGWATRPATSPAEAQALALAACNATAGGGCYNAQYPIPGDKPECFAVAWDGKILYEHHDPVQATAVDEVLKTCQRGANGPGCKISGQGCNNHH